MGHFVAYTGLAISAVGAGYYAINLLFLRDILWAVGCIVLLPLLRTVFDGAGMLVLGAFMLFYMPYRHKELRRPVVIVLAGLPLAAIGYWIG